MNIYQLNNLEEKTLIPGFKGKFIFSENMTIIHWTVEKGAVLPLHSHYHEQITTIMKGKFELTIQDDKEILRSGDISIIPPYLPMM